MLRTFERNLIQSIPSFYSVAFLWSMFNKIKCWLWTKSCIQREKNAEIPRNELKFSMKLERSEKNAICYDER